MRGDLCRLLNGKFEDEGVKVVRLKMIFIRKYGCLVSNEKIYSIPTVLNKF